MATKKKASKKKKTTCNIPKTKKVNGKTYKLVETRYSTKAKVDSANKNHRSKGKNKLAIRVENPCGSGYLSYRRG